MKRTTHKKPDLILCSDMHLRESKPTCRTDDYTSAQWTKLDYIQKLQYDYERPVLHAGDLFDHWKPSPHLLTRTMIHLPEQFYTVYGQHDLPQHNLELSHKCGINTLAQADKLKILGECHWGQKPNKASLIKPNDIKILVWHKMNYKGKKLWPGQVDPSALRLLKKYPQFNLIVTGDNHKPFVQEYEGRLLVNPGSMMRITAGQVDHRPRVYLWYADTNTVEPIYLPIEEGVISREHIEVQKERDNRIDAFISRLDDDWETEFSFEDNLQRFAEVNKTKQSVMNIIYKAIE